MAGLRSGDGPLSVRVRPSSLKRDCGRRTTSTGGKAQANVHAMSRLTLEPLRTLRSETKGQAGACPDRTRAIPCTQRQRRAGRLGICHAVRSACDSERPTTVTDGQPRSLGGFGHESTQSTFALVIALETSPQLVVRGRV